MQCVLQFTLTDNPYQTNSILLNQPTAPPPPTEVD